MKTTNLKSKIMAGVLCATLVGGVGTAFASTNAGEQLGNWYTSQVTPSLNRVWTGLVSYVTPQVNGLYQWKAGVQNGAATAVETAGTSEITRANTAIGEAKQTYIDAINSKKVTIIAGMETQYTNKVNSVNGTINGYADAAQRQAEREITTALNDKRDTALEAIDTEVGATKNQAIADLTTAINNAKTELEGLMAAKETAATDAVKLNLDNQITAKKKYITDKTAELELARKDEITAKGAEMQANAEKDLEDLVEAIDGVVPAE